MASPSRPGGGITAPYQVSGGFPAGGVLGLAVPPLPTPYNFSGAPPTGTVERIGSDATMIMPAITDMASPDQVSLTPSALAQSAVVALILMALLTLPVLLLRATVREGNGELRAWLARNSAVAHAIGRPLGRIPAWLRYGFSILAASVIYAMLDPSFGINLTTGAVAIALAGALIAVTFGHDVIRKVYVRTRFGRSTKLTTNPAGLAFAIGLVLLSRAFRIEPGLIFGLMTGLAFRDAVSRREEGHGLAVAAFVVLVIAFVAWFAWVPVRDAVATSSAPDFWLITLDTLLVTIWVVGVQTVAIALLPARVLDGERVLSWSRAGWAATLYMTLFVFAIAIMQPNTERFGERPSVVSLGAALVGITVLTAAAWLYATLRHRRVRGVSTAAS